MRHFPSRPLDPRARWPLLWVNDDQALLDAGYEGERVAALIRLSVCALLTAIPLRTVLAEPSVVESRVGLAVSGIATLLAAALLVLVRRGARLRAFGFASGLLDVSLVSAALATYLVLDTPHTAVNSKVVFEVYFLAIGGTCLRYDWRACVATGAAAIAQYAAIVAYADAHWALNDPRYAPYDYGMFSWTAQLSRLLLLLAATVLSTAIVVRARGLRQLSVRDRLTGLCNRGYFDERLEQELDRARRTGLPLSIAVIDVDHFKAFNDTHGHLAGDAALREVAAVLRRGVRSGDVAARYGGEEFVVLLPETAPEAAAERLDRLRESVAALRIALPRVTLPGRITISAGIGTWPADGDAADAVVFEADRRLFVAKARGRDRVVGRILAPPRAKTPGGSGKAKVTRQAR